MISNLSSAKQMNSSMLVLSVILMFLMATAVSSRSVQQSAKTYYTDELGSDLIDKQADEGPATGSESDTAVLEEVLRRLLDEPSSAEDTEKFREVRERKVSRC